MIHPYLTTFDIHIEQLGASAIKKILDLRDRKENLPEKSIIPFELIIRESTKARIEVLAFLVLFKIRLSLVQDKNMIIV